MNTLATESVRLETPVSNTRAIDSEHRSMNTCDVDGCSRKAHYVTAGLCKLHYGRKARTGSVHLAPRPSVQDRFWAKVQPTGFCWEWTGAHDSNGYGIFTGENGTVVRAHRVAYELLVAPILDGLELDHLCRNHDCCNPDHLDPVTHAVNVSRGQSLGARIARTGKCDRGHSMENAYARPDTGHRMCRQCAKDRRAAQGRSAR